MDTLARIESTVYDNLHGAEAIAVVPNSRDDITRGTTERDGEPDKITYWERSFIVTWRRPVRDNQPSLDNDGYTYATHRVHVNSIGEGACYLGNYDQTRADALADMLDRAKIEAKTNA